MSQSGWVGNLVVVLIATGVAILAAEGAVRVISPIYPSAYQPDSVLLHTVKPGSRPPLPCIARRTVGAPSMLRINSLGFRGPEFTLARTPGVKRVAIFGDSFIEGEYSEDSR